ncbi:YlxQ family RNA-binding protein [Aureibacillus halotolerans]|uniref:LSU ribosomal protein L7AE n=1 Tax=Aureibacillus halotolerans TaxID=1508390 RepID=A0A4R6U231_9BACI|nr:YlxQ family RNA-binding protein [Aureibacillus halotolerans]TDQ39686.1 LSU ribosomal protein L7AE [Aureibacillus halotolerans]
MNQKILNLLGLSYRARKCTIGEEAVLQEIKNRKAKLVLLSLDTSEGTRKRIEDKCTHYSVPIRYAEDRYQLGHAFGKHERVVAAIIETGFANKIIRMFDEN